MGFLRSIFGPSRDEIWGQVASNLGAEFVDGGFFGGDVVRLQHGEWEITLDEYTQSSGSGSNRSSTTYTRMRAPFVNKDNLYFELYRASIFSGLGKMLGFQDIEIDDPYFDEDFVIKGNSDEQVKYLFTSQKLRNLIYQQSNVHLSIRDDEGWFGASFPEGVDELYFSAYAIRDAHQLEELFNLFATTLERLVQIDSAYENDPRVEL
jgi:hypothetical protein